MKIIIYDVYIYNNQLYILVHNWLLKPFSRDYDQVSNITYVVYVNFIVHMSGGMFDSELQNFIWKTFHRNFIYFQNFLLEICWEEVA